MHLQFHLTMVQQPDCTFGPFYETVLIGRSDEADIRLHDRWASRHHCEIHPIDGRLVVHDLESTHGTLLNREHVTEGVLHPGDEITIGLTKLTVHCYPIRHTDPAPQQEALALGS